MALGVMSARRWKARVLLLLCLLTHAPAQAGSRQQPEESLFSTQQVADFAKKVEKYAGSKGARAFIVARLGTPQSELPKGVQFTHVGLAIYSRIETVDGKGVYGYAIHNLYQTPRDLARSELVMDYPLDFFAGAVELKAGVIIPKPILQQKLIAVIESGANQRLHNPNYSMVSNPFSSKYQNCTEYLLDIIFSAIYGTQNIQQIKANERAYFQPQQIKLPSIKRLFAPLVTDEVKMDDHSGPIQTTTFTAISKFLSGHGLADGYVVIGEEGKPMKRSHGVDL